MKRTDIWENKNKNTKLNVTLKQWQKIHFDLNLSGEKKKKEILLPENHSGVTFLSAAFKIKEHI